LFRAFKTGNVGLALDGLERDREADSVYAQSLTMFREAGLVGHPDYLTALGNRATLLEERWDLDSSRVLKEEVLAQLERIYPGGHDRVIIARSNAAFSQFLLGKAAVAESGFASANALAVRLHSAAHPLAIVTRNNIGRAQLLDGRAARAESTFREVLANVHAGVGDGHPYASMARLHLGRALGALGRTREALATLDAALTQAVKVLPPTHPRAAEIKAATAEVLLAAGRWGEAEVVAREAHAWRRENLPPIDPAVADAAVLVARSLAEGDSVEALSPGRREEVRQLAADAIARYRRVPAREREIGRVDSMLAVWQNDWARRAAR
jgi:tetratricopeptide (TPR) repeat protein